MKDKEYKQAWLTLKDRKIQNYIGNRQLTYRDDPFVKYLENELIMMDELDHTHEGQNIIDDLERGSDEYSRN